MALTDALDRERYGIGNTPYGPPGSPIGPKTSSFMSSYRPPQQSFPDAASPDINNYQWNSIRPTMSSDPGQVFQGGMDRANAFRNGPYSPIPQRPLVPSDTGVRPGAMPQYNAVEDARRRGLGGTPMGNAYGHAIQGYMNEARSMPSPAQSSSGIAASPELAKPGVDPNPQATQRQKNLESSKKA